MCRGKGKVVVGYAQPELAIRTAIDDRPANSVADLDELPGCPSCGKKVRIVVEHVEAPLVYLCPPDLDCDDMVGTNGEATKNEIRMKYW